ncbi:magnesium chelatase domain-containing protein [Pseudoduganella sp. HUAS MS19]
MPAFAIVGLADTEVKGARDRRRAAITDAGFELLQHRTCKFVVDTTNS